MCILTDLCHHYANLYPKKFVDIAHPLSVLTVLVGTAFFFKLQMFVITPFVFNDLLCKVLWIVGAFIVYNILGNQLACYCLDTSVDSLPQDRRTPSAEEEHLWHYCEICQRLMPPRSWHCNLCKCCILKRDHHCVFTATCIGHNNHRYFFWFTFYLTLGTGLSILTTIIYIVKKGYLFDPFPLYRIIFNVEHSKTSDGYSFCEYLIFLLNICACVLPAIMLAFQKRIVYFNTTYYKMCTRTYDLGFTKNCKFIMGERGLWTFISPTLKSPLPHDGTHWETNSSPPSVPVNVK
ncbi:probable palmitoyltransferase ZDHHC24 [Drosophila ficusphila]|uniref:probable palmitoyltransferase ZDHHC24 n=1 Tax=Drosophila ficusphila TaxID=30025 RepID=UPI0007E7D335|nr:probable palmitoyltransferase ZDHHC24 [Drosophila ficusphila]